MQTHSRTPAGRTRRGVHPLALAALAGVLCGLAPGARAADEEEAPPPIVPAERAPGVPLEATTRAPGMLIGPEPARALERIPGSGTSLTLEQALELTEPLSVQDAVRYVPGVTLRPEVQSGIIANIGVRGLNPDRSEKMLILEDGVPAGLAPYIENAAYYIPPFERMARVELLKGSGQILYGPHTVGGVLNLVTPDIPDEDCCVHGGVRAIYGSHGYMMGYAEAGQTVGRFGYLVQVLGKRGDGWRAESEFDLHDLNVKLGYRLSPRTSVILKGNVYESSSQDTYLGLTQGMYEDDAYQNPVLHDRLEVSWYSGHVSVRHEINARWLWTTDVYAAHAIRNWNRQDFARNAGFAAPPANTVLTVGDTTVDGGAIYLRASYGSRDREFARWGVESRVLGEHCLFGRAADLHVGARFHREKMIDERNNSTSLHAPQLTRNRDVRTVDAVALFAQERVDLTSRLTVSGGLRVEAYEMERRREVSNFLPVNDSGTSDNLEWIPGAGFDYRLGRSHTLYGGVHRGFSPPRLSQAILSDGTDAELDAERSWNYELGVRGTAAWLQYEVTGFFYDFRNQVVPDNESGGSSTENVNAGETRHLGVEALAIVDLSRAIWRRCDPCAPALFLDLGYTYLDTENTTDDGLFEGNELPYAPRHQGFASLRLELPSRFRFAATGHFVGEQFTDQANTRAASADGRRGLIDERFTLDLKASYTLRSSNLTVTAAVLNVLDETYIASRAPEGIFPGRPRHFFLGLEVDF